MLRLFVHLIDHYLKVRQALPHEAFTHSFIWNDQVEIEYTTDAKYMMAWTSLIPDLRPPLARALVDFVGARYPVSPHYHELKKLCPEIVFHNGTDEWVFYGGSFNPWHHGHQACLNLLSSSKTCFVLPDINPHKEERNFELVSTVIELSAKVRFNARQFLVPSFLIEKTKNPTVNWVERLRKEFPAQKLSLLLGFDSFKTIESWTRGKDLLLNLHALYVVSRMESETERDETIQKFQKNYPALHIELLGRHGFEELSSSEIKRRL